MKITYKTVKHMNVSALDDKYLVLKALRHGSL